MRFADPAVLDGQDCRGAQQDPGAPGEERLVDDRRAGGQVEVEEIK